MDIEQRIQRLRSLLNQYNHEYYVLNQSTIDDATYDQLMQELITLEKANPEFASLHSPSLRVGGAVQASFKKITHARMMLSLANAYDIHDLMNFDRRVKEGLHRTDVIPYVCELKIDGLAISIEYRQGKMVYAATRGDGEVGEDVTQNIKTIKSIPLTIPDERTIEVRGEVLMTRSVFNQLNQERQHAGEPLLANPRNAAAGSIRQLDTAMTASRQLDCYLYYVVNATELGMRTHQEALAFLKKQGFKTNPETKQLNGIDQVIQYIESYQNRRGSLAYDTDGIVVKVNTLSDQPILGYTAKTPRWAVAYKYPPELVETTLEQVIFTVGRTGKITPNAVLTPVIVSGSMIARATLHNEDFMMVKDLHLGDRVLIRKAGEVIPEVVQVLPLKRSVDAHQVLMIKHCPACGSALVRVEAMHFCMNEGCSARQVEGIIHFASKVAMDIKGLGEKIIEELVQLGFIRSIPDLYRLHEKKHELLLLNGYSDKSVRLITNAIEDSKQRSLEKLLVGLGIKEVGEKTAKMLAKRFLTLQALSKATVDELLALADTGPVVSDALIQYFKNPKHQAIISELTLLGVNQTYLGINTSKPTFFSGKTVVITGSFQSYDRPTLTSLLESMGAKVTSSISKHTHMLICGEDAGSKLEKAESLGVAVILEPRLLAMLKEEKV
jgi:DNA ligase (NAD+)